VDASYGGLLATVDHRSITGIVITLGGTAIFAKTHLQRTTALSSTEAETMAGCDAEKQIKYFRKLFTCLRLELTGPTPTGEDNAGTIMIAHHRRASGRTRHMDIQFVATQEWVQQGTMSFFKIDDTANPSDALSKVLYRILHRRHFDRLMRYYSSPHATHTEFLDNPNNNPSYGCLFAFLYSYFIFICPLPSTRLLHTQLPLSFFTQDAATFFTVAYVFIGGACRWKRWREFPSIRRSGGWLAP
jgi:hypothetical protein